MHPRRLLVPALGILLIVLTMAGSSPATSGAGSWMVSGAGHTVIEGGTGGKNPQPVTTLLALRATADGGRFECLALAPDAVSGPGSGAFETNVMYVTGDVTSLSVRNGAATLRGVAVVTGIGAGPAQPFEVVVRAGGPGTTIKLTVSGLVFHEIMLDGRVKLGRVP